MPRYYFTTYGHENYLDRDGTDLAGPEAAKSAAVIAASEVMKDPEGKFWNASAWRMIVTDEAGAVVCELSIHGSTG